MIFPDRSVIDLENHFRTFVFIKGSPPPLSSHCLCICCKARPSKHTDQWKWQSDSLQSTILSVDQTPSNPNTPHPSLFSHVSHFKSICRPNDERLIVYQRLCAEGRPFFMFFFLCWNSSSRAIYQSSVLLK